MRRTVLLLVGGALWLFLFAIPVLADNGPHIMGKTATTDSCAGCHRAHTAPSENLLVQAQPGLCYQCHGAGGLGATTDVYHGAQYVMGNAHPAEGTAPTSGDAGFAGALAGGGFAYALIGAHSPTVDGSGFLTAIPALSTGEAVNSSHVVDGTTAGTMWGNGAIDSGAGKAGVVLECGSCHDPHGNGQYRILKPAPNDSGIASNGNGQVWIDDAGTKGVPASNYVYTTTNYWGNRVATNYDPYSTAYATTVSKSITYHGTATTVTGLDGGFYYAVSTWCSLCHTRYLAPSGSAGTDSGDSIFTYRHAINDGSSTAHAPACVTCHVSHGSNAAVNQASTSPQQSVYYPGSTTVEDSALLRVDNQGVCEACHKK